MRIALVVLVLNEIEGLQLYMPRIDQSWVDQILIVDGGSTDGSVWNGAKQMDIRCCDRSSGVCAGAIWRPWSA